ncbi:MAG: PRC-barrel domain-containing protein [Candidatus Binatia bacterium]
MKTKEIIITGLTAGAFLLAPAAFAEEASHAENHMKSSTHQAAGETTGSQQKEIAPRAQQGSTTTTGAEQKEAAQSSPQSNEQKQMKAQESSILRASEVIGYTVKNPQGQELGQIEDLVIDPEHGRIAYAVLSFGGFLGLGDKLFAIPWDAMKPMPSQQTVQLDVSKEKLEKAPGFNKDNWPNVADREWGLVVYKYYDLDPYWE